jgi:hypothetical protein
LIVDEALDAELALKTRLLAEHPAEVVAGLAGSEAGATEALELIEVWLDVRQLAVPSADTPGDRHPIDIAGRLVQEDLCLMERREDGWVLTAASVCFPSHWRLAEKMGRPLAEIHAPVAHYDDTLRARVDTFFDRLRADKPVWRRNLSIHNHPDLFSPDDHERPDSFGSTIDGVWLRSEDQTLRLLPQSGSVLFTIKTEVCAASVLAERPDLAHPLAAKLSALSHELNTLGRPAPFPAWFPAWLANR